METVLESVARQEIKTQSKGKLLWNALAWVAVICGGIGYFVGWLTVITGTQILNIGTQVWFYDAIAGGVFAIFFLYAAKS